MLDRDVVLAKRKRLKGVEALSIVGWVGRNASLDIGGGDVGSNNRGTAWILDGSGNASGDAGKHQPAREQNKSNGYTTPT